MEYVKIDWYYDEYVAFCTCPNCNKGVELYLPKNGDEVACGECDTEFIIQDEDIEN
jgi:ribosomal protein S27AE